MIPETEITRECELYDVRRDQAIRAIKDRRIVAARAREIPRLRPIQTTVIEPSGDEFELALEHARKLREDGRV